MSAGIGDKVEVIIENRFVCLGSIGRLISMYKEKAEVQFDNGLKAYVPYTCLSRIKPKLPPCIEQIKENTKGWEMKMDNKEGFNKDNVVSIIFRSFDSKANMKKLAIDKEISELEAKIKENKAKKKEINKTCTKVRKRIKALVNLKLHSQAIFAQLKQEFPSFYL